MKWGSRLIVLAIITVWSAILIIPDKKLHVIFCNVGQGDATHITYKNTQILIDGGPDSSVIKCLGEHVPFFDKKIEVVILTHDNSDHSTGLDEVYKRYAVGNFKPRLVTDDVVESGLLKIEVLWPKSQIIDQNINIENDQGIVSKIKFGGFEVLMMADVTDTLIEPIGEVEVVKISHHGSDLSNSAEWLEQVKPKLAVISVGKNSFGHPGNNLLKILGDMAIEIRRTDLDGEVEVVSDGKSWYVK